MKQVEIDKNLLRSLLTLATLIEARDAYTGGHTWRVSRYAALLTERLGLPAQDVFIVQVGALVHDLGKVGVPDEILNKKGSLEQAEFDIMRRHPAIGKDVVEDHPLAPIILPIVAEHHERVDGKGYPAARSGDAINFYGRIVSVADAFDAMTSTRPYRPAMNTEKALGIIREARGTQFDARIVDAFLGLAESGELRHTLGHSADGRPLLSCDGCGPVIALKKNDIVSHSIVCPSCTGEYQIHAKGDTFELEFRGMSVRKYAPEADFETVSEILKKAVKEVKVA